MNIPSLPTDNINKFLFLACIVYFVYHFYDLKTKSSAFYDEGNKYKNEVALFNFDYEMLDSEYVHTYKKLKEAAPIFKELQKKINCL